MYMVQHWAFEHQLHIDNPLYILCLLSQQQTERLALLCNQAAVINVLKPPCVTAGCSSRLIDSRLVCRSS